MKALIHGRVGFSPVLAVIAAFGTVRDRHHMPGSDLSSFDALLKDDYAPAIVNELQDENVANALKFMESEAPDETWQGRKKVQPIRIGRNYSTGSIGAGSALPQAGRTAHRDFEIPMRDTYGRVGFERYTMEQSKNKKGAFAQVMELEMDALTESIAFARNRMAWGYGAGIIALVNGAVAAGATTVTVDAPGNVAGSVMGNRFLFGDTTSGQFIAFLNPATNAIEHTAFVSGVSAGGTQITIDTAAPAGGITDNAKIVIAQTPTQHSLNKEPEGILAGVDDGTYVGTYHNLSRTTYPILNSHVVTGVGALSLDAIQQAIDALSIRVGGSVDFFACEHAVRRAYLTLLELDRRYTGADLMRPDGGTAAAKKPTGKTITYGDIPFVVDRDAPYRMLFGIRKASWIRYVLQEGQFADEEGSVLKWVSGFDQYTAFFFIMDNFHCQSPNRNFRMEGIDVNQLVAHAA